MTTTNTTPKPTVKDVKSIGKFIISDRLQQRIDFLHKFVGSTEWSAILLYKTNSATIRDLKDLVFTGIDLYPMDIGNQAKTQFKYDGSIVDMYDKIDDAMELSTGMIHSHHNMTAFISGTDRDDLIKQAELFNYYISLVVAFDKRYVCRASIYSTNKKHEEYTFKDVNGEVVTIENDVEESSIIIADLDIEFETTDVSAPDWLKERATALKEVVKTATLPTTRRGYGGYEGGNYQKAGQYKEVYKGKTTGASILLTSNERFVISLLTMVSYTKDVECPYANVYKAAADFSAMTDEDFGMWNDMFDINVEIIHDNIYETNLGFKSHLKIAGELLNRYKYFDRIEEAVKEFEAYAEVNCPTDTTSYGEFESIY